jgi:hypothetical protein
MDQSSIDQLLHLPPGAHVVFMDVRDSMIAARTQVASRRMVVGKRPVNQIQIEVVDLQIVQGFSHKQK